MLRVKVTVCRNCDIKASNLHNKHYCYVGTKKAK